MNIHSLGIAVAFAAALTPGVALAQHEAHQAGPGQPSAGLGQCGRVQPAIDKIITGAMARVESARLSNNPAEMRAAVDQLEAALRDIRAQLAPCAAGEAAADPHSGHMMPGMAPASAAPAAAPMDHSKMPMGEAQPGRVMDPVNGLMVDPATAPKTTYQGQTYYFSSEQSRKEFLENPAKFAKKPKG
jgi:YHS domain-containing protein